MDPAHPTAQPPETTGARPGPRLAAVPGPAPSPPRRRSRLPWVLGIALVVVGLLWLFQAQRAARLADRLAGVEQELEDARLRLDAYDVHLDAVRGRVRGLSGQLGELEALLERGPDPLGPATDDLGAPGAPLAPDAAPPLD